MAAAPVEMAAQPVPDYPVPYANYNVLPQANLKIGLATTAMVLGIVNLIPCLSVFVVPLIAGLVISGVALNQIKKHPHEYGGKPMAVYGLVLNIVAAVVTVLMYWTHPNLFKWSC